MKVNIKIKFEISKSSLELFKLFLKKLMYVKSILTLNFNFLIIFLIFHFIFGSGN